MIFNPTPGLNIMLKKPKKTRGFFEISKIFHCSHVNYFKLILIEVWGIYSFIFENNFSLILIKKNVCIAIQPAIIFYWNNLDSNVIDLLFFICKKEERCLPAIWYPTLRFTRSKLLRLLNRRMRLVSPMSCITRTIHWGIPCATWSWRTLRWSTAGTVSLTRRRRKSTCVYRLDHIQPRRCWKMDWWTCRKSRFTFWIRFKKPSSTSNIIVRRIRMLKWRLLEMIRWNSNNAILYLIQKNIYNVGLYSASVYHPFIVYQ